MSENSRFWCGEAAIHGAAALRAGTGVGYGSSWEWELVVEYRVRELRQAVAAAPTGTPVWFQEPR